MSLADKQKSKEDESHESFNVDKPSSNSPMWLSFPLIPCSTLKKNLGLHMHENDNFTQDKSLLSAR